MKLTQLSKILERNYDSDALVYKADDEFFYPSTFNLDNLEDIKAHEMMVYGGFYHFEKGWDSPKIFLLCRGKRSGKFKLKIQGFYPYCFQLNDNGGHKTYLGKSCEKIIFKGQHPSSVKIFRERIKSKGFPMPLEADILFCLKEGTSISLNNGYKNIENCVVGDEILSSNESTLQQNSAKIIGIKEKRVNKYLRIKTQLSSIECDENHKIPILDSNGNIIIKIAKDILPTDFLLTSELVGKFGDGYELKINHNNSLHGSQLKLREGIVDNDFFELYGYYIGDGTRVLHRNLSIKDREYDNILFYANIFRKYTGTKSIPRRIEKENSYVFDVGCKSLSEIFKEYKLNLLTDRVHIDERFIGNCDKYQISSILRGLYDAEGHVADDAITFTSISKQLINQICLLLKRYGILSSIIKSKNKSFDKSHLVNDVYMLTISECHSIDRFKFHINFNDKRKKEALDKINSKKNRFYYVYPFGKIIEEIKQSLNLHHNYWKGHNFRFHDWKNGGHNISYYSLIKIIDGFKQWIKDNKINNKKASELIDKIEDILFKKNVIPIKIKSIEIVNESVNLYDISLDKDYMFYANGLITHNCRRFLMDVYDFFKPNELIYPKIAIVDIETNFPYNDNIISYAINPEEGDLYYASKFDVNHPIELVLDLYEQLQEYDVVAAWMGEDLFDARIIEKNFKRISEFIKRTIYHQKINDNSEDKELFKLLLDRGYLKFEGNEKIIIGKVFVPKLEEHVAFIDLLEISHKMYGREIRGNWSLDNAGRRIGGIAKSLDEEDMKLYVNELPEEKLFVYNCIDTIIPEVIDNYLGGIEGHLILAWSLQNTLEDVMITAVVNDIALIRAYHRGNQILNTREYVEEKSKEAKYKAAKPDAKEGVYDGIVTYDIVHAYPSAVISLNTSSETKDKDGNHIAPNGVRFNDKNSIFIDTLKDLMKERKIVKTKLKQLKKDDVDYKKYKSIDFALKTQIAAFSHGIFGWANSRMKDFETADAITAVVRDILDYIKITCDISGLIWNYCHTDSIYINNNKENTEKILNYLNEKIRGHCKLYKIIPELELKGFYPVGYIHSPARNVLVPEGIDIDNDEDWEVTGMDFMRSECPEPISKIEVELIKLKLKRNDDGMIVKLKEMIKELPKISSIELGLVKPFNKKVSEYGKVKKDGTIGNIPFHITALKRAQEEYGLKIELKEKFGVLPIITDEVVGVRKKRRKRVDMAFNLEDGLPDAYKIDFETYLDGNLFGKINGLFNLKTRELKELVLTEEIKKELGIYEIF